MLNRIAILGRDLKLLDKIVSFLFSSESHPLSNSPSGGNTNIRRFNIYKIVPEGLNMGSDGFKPIEIFSKDFNLATFLDEKDDKLL